MLFELLVLLVLLYYCILRPLLLLALLLMAIIVASSTARKPFPSPGLTQWAPGLSRWPNVHQKALKRFAPLTRLRVVSKEGKYIYIYVCIYIDMDI